jgi:hypothetical protein
MVATLQWPKNSSPQVALGNELCPFSGGAIAILVALTELSAAEDEDDA